MHLKCGEIQEERRRMETSPMKGSRSKGCKEIGATILSTEDMKNLEGQVVGKISVNHRNKRKILNLYIFIKKNVNIKRNVL